MSISFPLIITLELWQYLQLKGKTKLPYYHSARICKVTLDVSHSPEELLNHYIFVLPPAQELKKDFLLD